MTTKKILAIAGAIAVVALIIIGAVTGGEVEQDTTTKVPLNEDLTNHELLVKDAYRLNGGGSITEVLLEDSVATIRYTTIYSVYKQHNAQSAVTEGHYNSYWHTGDAISKAIVGAPVNIMRDLYFIKQVNVELETEQELYTFSMTRRQAEQELGRPLTDLATNEAQAKYFADPIIYVDAERERWFNTYGQKKSQVNKY